MALNKLNSLTAARARDSGLYGDGGGLYLQVAKHGARSWIFRYKIKGRSRYAGLGPAHTVTLAEARAKATDARRLLLEGQDPIEARRATLAAAHLEKANSLTFREACEHCITVHRAGWKNQKHASQWRATLEAYAYPLLGALPVAAVDTGLVVRVLEPIWTTKPETAKRLRGRIERVVDFARVRGWRAGENPARWRGHLDHVLAKRSKGQLVKHHAAMPFGDVPAFLGELQKRAGMAPLALAFLLLTAARTNEVIGANWNEIDLKDAVWTIPAHRMKAGREHRVPLTNRAIEILRGVTRVADNPHVFSGQRRGAGLSNMAMLELMRNMRPGLTVHGFRSSFRTWIAERTNFSADVAEAALAHTVSSKVEAAYQRGDLFDKRRRLMEAWAQFCTEVSAEQLGRVVALRREPIH